MCLQSQDCSIIHKIFAQLESEAEHWYWQGILYLFLLEVSQQGYPILHDPRSIHIYATSVESYCLSIVGCLLDQPAVRCSCWWYSTWLTTTHLHNTNLVFSVKLQFRKPSVQKLCFFPPNVVLRWRSTTDEDHPQRSSSIKSCLWSKVVFHQR